MIKIPQNSQWQQNNKSDLFGNIWSSFNLDLTSKPGVLKTTRMLSLSNSTDTTNLGIAVAFRNFNGIYYAATGNDGGTGTISKSGIATTSGFALDTATDKPTTISQRYSDMEVFNERLYVSLEVSTTVKLARLDISTGWLNGGVTVTGGAVGYPKPMCVYADRLYVVADAGKINSMNTSETFAATIGTTAQTLILTNPTSNTITFLRPTSAGIWIGTVNQNGGKGHVYLWKGVQVDGTDLTTYRLESSGTLAATVKDDVLYIMDTNGKLLAFNGGTFQELDRLPIKQGRYLFYSLGAYNERWIHPNGMTVQDDRILILINNEYRGNTTLTSEEIAPSGVWEWTKETGLYHKYSLSYHKALAGSITDYGQRNLTNVGALTYLKSPGAAADDNGSILASASLYTGSSSTTLNHILTEDMNDTIQKYGYFVTPKIFSSNITEIWQKIYLRFKKLLTATDKIVVKYRTSDISTLAEASITWYNDTSIFKTSSTITTWSVGDEVEVLQGAGSGKCAHIVSITDIGGGFNEVQLDENFTGVTNTATAKARAQKWKKLGSFSNQTDEFYSKPIDTGNSNWIQFKVCFQSTGADEFYDINLITTPGQKAI